MTYEEKISLLNEADFYRLFSSLGAAPRNVSSAGHQSIQILGFCHWKGPDAAHSAVFDPETLKVTCFSECSCGMQLHTWIKKVLEIDNPQDAKDFIEDWIDNQDIDLSNRVARNGDFEYRERPYKPEHIEPLQDIDGRIIRELYTDFDCSLERLKNLVWCHQDGISAEILKEYDVAYYPERDTIILPHHNILGGIVGIYERSFRELRKKIKDQYPDMPYSFLMKYPRAKYVPLVKKEEYQNEEKTSWSFPNSLNLYGLHKAAEGIRQAEKAIVFEGGKSVMLARQYGYPIAVATHTFGIHTNHISMLIEAGAKEIILAFDKQYEVEEGQQWELYEKKTRDIADKVKDYVKISRIRDVEELLDFKDAPIDKGREIFIKLYDQRELLDTSTPIAEDQSKLKTKPGRIEREKFKLNFSEEERKLREDLKRRAEERSLKFL